MSKRGTASDDPSASRHLPAVVPSFSKRESNGAILACAHGFILDPMIGIASSRIIADDPTEDAAARIAHVDGFVISAARDDDQRGSFSSRVSDLLGNAKCCDSSRARILLALESSVHS